MSQKYTESRYTVTSVGDSRCRNPVGVFRRDLYVELLVDPRTVSNPFLDISHGCTTIPSPIDKKVPLPQAETE